MKFCGSGAVSSSANDRNAFGISLLMNFEFAWISNDSTSLGGGLALHFVPPPREEEEGKGEQVSEGGLQVCTHVTG